MIRGGGGITRDAEALMDMMMRNTSTKTGEIQGADNEGAEVLKATAEITIIDPKYISCPPMTKLTMEDGPKWMREIKQTRRTDVRKRMNSCLLYTSRCV